MFMDALGKLGPHPALRDIIVEDFNRMEAASDSIVMISAAQVEILQQRTFGSLLAPPVGQTARGSVSSCLIRLRDVPSPGRIALMLTLSASPDDAEDWHLISYNARSMRMSSPEPFEPMLLIAPAIGLACGIYASAGQVARLRVTSAGGQILEDVSSQSMLILAPQGTDQTGWSDADAPFLQLLNANGQDIVPPARMIMPSDS